MTREEILAKNEWLPEQGWTKDNILAAMPEFSQQEAIAFAEWASKSGYDSIQISARIQMAYWFITNNLHNNTTIPNLQKPKQWIR